MLDNDLRRVVADQAERVRAQTPFADFLSEQRSRLSADPRIEPAHARNRLAPYRHVDAERDAHAVLDRRRAVIEQRYDTPEQAGPRGKPGRQGRRLEQRRHTTAHIVAVERTERVVDP